MRKIKLKFCLLSKMKKDITAAKDYCLSPNRNQEEKSIHEILGISTSDWPPPFRLNEALLEEKYIKLVKILEMHNYYVEFAAEIPLYEAYRYLTEILIHDKDYELNDCWGCIVTGCDGDCPSCFQKEYCQLVTETWTQDEMEKELIRRCETASK